VKSSIDGIDTLRAGLDVQGAGLDRVIASYDETLGEIDLWIDEVSDRLDTKAAGLGETRELLQVLDNLEALNAVADNELRLVVPILAAGPIDPELHDQLVGNAAIAESTRAKLDAQIPERLRPEWQQFKTASTRGDRASAGILERIQLGSSEPLGLEARVELAKRVEPLVSRLDAQAQLQVETGVALVVEASNDEAIARADFERVVLLGASLILITFLTALIVARHMSTSLRHLGRAAALLQTGELDAEDIPAKGPREIVDTAEAFNTMSHTLRAVDAHATAISNGTESEVSLLPVPGHLGESLRNSLSRVQNMADRLRHEAWHDSLTGLTNRAGVWVALEELLNDESETLLTIMFVDLDRFKRVNDTFGHQVGDVLLTAAGYRLQNAIGEDRVLARLGGDEFLVVATDFDCADDAVVLAEHIATELDEPFTIDGRLLRISASIGVSQEYARGQSVADILRSADLALYEAKRHRSRSVVFSDDALLQAAVANLRVEEELRGSWTRGEMSLYLQPLVRPSDGSPASAEALMRWTKADGTMVSPGVFIPLAEESGMIVEIDQWMVNEAARTIAEWRRFGHAAGDIPIAVNISGQHFTDGDLVRTITDACDLHGVEPQCLVVEVTESCAIGDIDHTVAVLDELHKMGIRISLDDFGTGYSSLSYLQQLPIDTVKIDRSFITGLALGGANAKIVELVTALSVVLDLAVVAEGVETEEQARCLEELGIDYLQGFFFAKPMPAALFGNWVEQTSGFPALGAPTLT
jgi:diguanylate cyclase (GGDEF)-like protein